MKIAKYIADLLFEYECIVIPGFGGFITKEIPAQIQPIQNHFVPPTKEIVFNVHLKTNDGLLVNHLARQEKLTYIEAREAVERFVKKCLIELNNGKQINFRKIGTISMNAEKNILFEPDKSQNYLADSFGLKSFVSPSIKRTIIRPAATKTRQRTYAEDRSPKETVKREKVKPQARRKPVAQGPKYVNINISFILIVIAIAAFTYLKFGLVKQYYNNYASIIPFFYSSPNEYIVKNFDNQKMMAVITLPDKLSPTETKVKVKKDTTKTKKEEYKSPDLQTPGEKDKTKDEPKNEPVKKDTETETEKTQTDVKPGFIAQSQPGNFKYFIIAGVFREKMNAEKYTLQLKSKGFNAMVVDQNSKGLYRVCFEAFNDLNQANQQMAIIRKEEEANAWLLSI